GDGLAGLDGGFDALDVEEDAGILFGRHHVGEDLAVLGVVAVQRGQFAVVGGGAEVHVAADPDLPADLHAFGVDAGQQAAVAGSFLPVLRRVGQRHVELGAAEDAGGVVDGRINRIALVRENAVEALDIGDLGDFVAFHVIATDAGQAV